MQKNDLIKNVADKTGVSFVQCEKIIDAFIDEIKNCFIRGDRLTLKNFASFEVKEMPAHLGRNPHTDNVEMFPARKVVKCKFSQAIKDIVNKSEEKRNENQNDES